MRFVEHRLRDEPLGEEHLRALVRAPREFEVGALGLDDVLFELRLGGFERRPSRQQVRFRSADDRRELIFVELDEDVTFLDRVVDVDMKGLDDAVGFRFDLDLGDGLDLPGRHDRADHRPAFDRREPGRIDVGRRAFQRPKTDNAGDGQNAEADDQVQRFSGFLHSRSHT